MTHRMILKWATICAVTCVLSVCAELARAEDPPPADAKLRTGKVALFKNGLGFLSSSATLPESAETVRLGQLPVRQDPCGTLSPHGLRGLGVAACV